MSDEQRDNGSLPEKLRWRREAVRLVVDPLVVCECYGGWGLIGRQIYGDVPGVVLERDAQKAEALAKRRPTWAVYRGDSVKMVAAGAGRHLPVTYLDVDPYGSPWPVLRAWFASDRPHAPQLVVVAHDGMNRLVKMGRAWSVAELESVVRRFGNTAVKEHYGEISREVLVELGALAGYTVEAWRWADGGDRGKTAHWLAVLSR